MRPFSAKKKKVLYFFFVIAFFLSGWAASMIRILGEAKIHGMHFILYKTQKMWLHPTWSKKRVAIIQENVQKRSTSISYSLQPPQIAINYSQEGIKMKTKTWLILNIWSQLHYILMLLCLKTTSAAKLCYGRSFLVEFSFWCPILTNLTLR